MHLSHSVHPHACGENYQIGAPLGYAYGTPPRLWGKRLRMDTYTNAIRYTPTPVGKTGIVNLHDQGVAVHPHACGENIFDGHAGLRQHGTPPRLWGKHAPCDPQVLLIRYTPTPVGKTASSAVTASRKTGTPPRLWGKLRRRVRNPDMRRYTPTPVGKTDRP